MEHVLEFDYETANDLYEYLSHTNYASKVYDFLNNLIGNNETTEVFEYKYELKLTAKEINNG